MLLFSSSPDTDFSALSTSHPTSVTPHNFSESIILKAEKELVKIKFKLIWSNIPTPCTEPSQYRLFGESGN